ncbi:hypothetical protein F0562_019174 [Nyssa sinensis]|uniref:Response regulatory domain-containing protein n=1 Tax=Nyssa sinensis TaxID=561372 RepID=A0A5J4ZBL2_9ASTE|nr:hypothetical protein F0562_019174 [Nyssa sinensis]
MDNKKVASVESSQSLGRKEICILVMDNDLACLNIVAEMLRYCSHKVLHFGRTTDAFNAIWKRKDRLDIVLTNVNSSDANGFEILKNIEKEFKLPIVSMFPDENKRIVSRGLSSGVTLYFVKSLSMNDNNNLWQYTYEREKGKMVASEQLVDNAQRASAPVVGAGIGNTSSVGEVTRNYQKRKRKEPKETSEKNEVSRDDSPSEKKVRVVWTSEMHHKFLEAIEQLGHERAFPKKIVEVMNVPGLTRENVASHLQKYRMCLKRAQEGVQPSSSIYGINLTTGFKEACFPSSHSALNFSSQYSTQQHNVTPLPQTSNGTISIPSSNRSCFINPIASTQMSSLGHEQLHMSNQGNVQYPYTHNVSSLHVMPQSNINYSDFGTAQPNTQIGSAQVESTFIPNALVNHNYRVYSDQTKNILFSIANGSSSSNTNQPTSSSISSTYVGYRLTGKGESIQVGQMGVLGNDKVLSADDNFLNESSVPCPSTSINCIPQEQPSLPPTSINCIPQEQPSLPPLPPLHHEFDSFGADGDLDVLLSVTTSTSPQMFWDSDFDDILFNHTD